jgi:hypothetical protein
MTTYAIPSGIHPESMTWGFQRNNIRHESALTGSAQVVGLPTYRWTVDLNLPARDRRDSGAQEAFFNSLVGGSDLVTLHRLDRPVPQGTMRGSPTLSAGVAQFSDTLVLGGAVGTNLLLNSSFENDSNADGVADGWDDALDGSAGTVARSVVSGSAVVAGDKVQRVSASALDPGVSVGVYTTLSIAALAGSPATISAYMRKSGISSGDFNFRLYAQFVDAGAAVVGSGEALQLAGADFAFHRLNFTSIVPPTAVSARIYVMALGVSLGTVSMDADAVQVQAGALTPYEPGATVKAGDMLGVGSQLFQVRTDAAANDAGLMTVQTVNRTRVSLTSGAAVVWDRPTATFAVQDQSSAFNFGPGAMGPSSFRLVETY